MLLRSRKEVNMSPYRRRNLFLMGVNYTPSPKKAMLNNYVHTRRASGQELFVFSHGIQILQAIIHHGVVLN